MNRLNYPNQSLIFSNKILNFLNLSFLLNIFSGFLIMAIFIGCKGVNGSVTAASLNPTSTPTPFNGGVSGSTPIGTVERNSFYVQAIAPSSLISIYNHEQSDFSKECKISSSETDIAKKDLYCIIDIQELDLYAQVIKLNYNLPSAMCVYTQVYPYWFWDYEPPPQVLSISATITNGAPVFSPVTTDVSVNSDGSVASCKYDYSKSSGPNCCEGKLTENIVTTLPTPLPTVHKLVDLGGKISNCINGPGLEYSKLPTGYPTPTIKFNNGLGMNDVLTLTTPASKFRNNLYIGNYFQPTVFGNSTDVFPVSTLPLGINGTTGSGPGNPYYQFSCLDSANDIVARIRVLIRSWDTVSGFTAQSNPYTSGNQPQFAKPWHDRATWDEQMNSGTDSYPSGK